MMRTLPPMRDLPEFDVSPPGGDDGGARRSNRRRLRVFLLVFVLVLLPGMVWNLLRPAEYRATARMQINPGTTDVSLTPAPGVPPAPAQADPSGEFLTQVQILTSRPLLEKVSHTLATAGYPLAAPGGDPVASLQRMIGVTPVPGTEVVEVQAIGAPPELPALALNALVEAYREQMLAAYGAAESEQLAQAREEVARLEQTVAERRSRLDAFRSRYGVVSSERDENASLASAKGLSASLSKAVEQAANADARVRALREGIAGGKGSAQAKDDPTLADMEQRASKLREGLRDMERTYTPDFMAMDPQARAARARLADLEQQITAQRGASRQAALASAQEDAATAHAAAERLQAQIAAQRQDAQSFSSRFNQAKSLEDDLAQIDKAHRAALERLAKLEASERGRHPVLNLVEGASVPQAAFRPAYARDGAIVLAAAFLSGLLAMWFVELFNRSAPVGGASTTVVIPQPWLAAGGGMQLRGPIDVPPGLLPAAPSQNAGLLPVSALPPRALRQDEVTALLAAATDTVRFVCAALLLGVTADELVALRQQDFDVASGDLRIGGVAPRVVNIPPWLRAFGARGAGDAPLLANASGEAVTPAELRAQILCAAVDAGLEGAAGVTPEVLRHTCIAWLVHQGVRFSDLASLVGRIEPDALAAYAEMVPEGSRHAAGGDVAPMPALRDVPAH